MELDTGNPFLDTPPEFVSSVETPRLGILHLMVLTACVALYIGTMQGLMRVVGLDMMEGSEEAAGPVSGVAAGAGLAGLLLFVARRRRGMWFPIHPGEFLIIIQGVGAVVTLGCFTVYVLFEQSGSVGLADGLGWGALSGICVIYLALWIWAMVCLEALRWRLFLLSIPVCYVLSQLLFFWVLLSRGVEAGAFSSYVAPFFIGVVLGIVVLLDTFKGLRYPWTHWFGVAVYFWLAAGALVSGVFLWLSL